MQVTLHGGPHDGRRINIDPAAAERHALFIPDIVEDLSEPGEELPTARPISISIYQRTTWMGERTPAAADNQTFVRWQYTGHHQ